MTDQNVLAKVSYIPPAEVFILQDRLRKSFDDQPIHIHNECELTYITGAKGVRRIVGDHIATIGDVELVLITGDYLEHGWFNGRKDSETEAREVTIRFRHDVFSGGPIECKQFFHIRKMLGDARHGIAVSPAVIEVCKPIIEELARTDSGSFTSLLLFLSLLNTISRDNYKTLSRSMFSNIENNYDSRRINKVMEYLNINYMRRIKLCDAAAIIHMSEASFSRYIKLRTGQSFVDCVNSVRLAAASRALIEEPSRNISEIAYGCGFNSLSHFNRIFKKHKGFTPYSFRECYSKNKFAL